MSPKHIPCHSPVFLFSPYTARHHIATSGHIAQLTYDIPDHKALRYQISVTAAGSGNVAMDVLETDGWTTGVILWLSPCPAIKDGGMQFIMVMV